MSSELPPVASSAPTAASSSAPAPVTASEPSNLPEQTEYVLLELPDSQDPAAFASALHLQLSNFFSSSPILTLNGETFRGELKRTVGTNLFFTRDEENSAENNSSQSSSSTSIPHSTSSTDSKKRNRFLAKSFKRIVFSRVSPENEKNQNSSIVTENTSETNSDPNNNNNNNNTDNNSNSKETESK